jgi:hypothetical protein
MSYVWMTYSQAELSYMLKPESQKLSGAALMATNAILYRAFFHPKKK